MPAGMALKSGLQSICQRRKLKHKIPRLLLQLTRTHNSCIVTEREPVQTLNEDLFRLTTANTPSWEAKIETHVI